MSEDRLEQILERLEALEQKLQSAPAPTGETGGAGLVEAPDEGDPDEKRRIDLIVGLVTENVDQLLRARLAEAAPVPMDEGRLADRCAERVRHYIYDLLGDDLQGRDGGRHDGHHRHGPRRGGGRREGPGGRGPMNRGPRDRGPGDMGPRDMGPRDGGDRG